MFLWFLLRDERRLANDGWQSGLLTASRRQEARRSRRSRSCADNVRSMSGLDWPGEERRRPAAELADLGRPRAARRLARGGGRAKRHGPLPRPRRRLRPEAVLPLLRRARERVRRRRRRREPRRRAARAGRGAARRGRELRRRPLHAGARALRRPGAGGARAAARHGSRRPRARLDARRPGLPPLAAGLLALDARRPAAAVRGERGAGSRSRFARRRDRVAASRCCSAPTPRSRCRRARVPQLAAGPSGCSTARPARSTGVSRCCASRVPGSLIGELPRRRRPSAPDAALPAQRARHLRASTRPRSSPGSSSRRSCSTRSATTAFGIWSFIGSITIYLSVLDFGVGPSIVRFAARGARAAGRPRTRTRSPRPGSCSTRLIGLVTLPLGVALAWLVPELIDTPARPRLAGADRDAARRPLDRGALPARALQQPARRAAALRRPEPRQLRLDRALRRRSSPCCMPHGGGLVLLGALTLGDDARCGSRSRSRWLRRELPGAAASAARSSRASGCAS